MIVKLPQIDISWNYMILANLFYQVLRTKFNLDETEEQVSRKSQDFLIEHEVFRREIEEINR